MDMLSDYDNIGVMIERELANTINDSVVIKPLRPFLTQGEVRNRRMTLGILIMEMKILDRTDYLSLWKTLQLK